jgi:DMSO/TMAO reductase YedYZ molybdopterin-dependent catalytic subunit
MAFDLFTRRQKQREKYGDRLPPGQHVVENWPVLTYGGTPRIDLDSWRLRLYGLVEEEVEFSWEEFRALPVTDVKTDIHCVTTWSKFDTNFSGVSMDDLLERVRLKAEANAVIAHCYGGYTTNLLLKDLVQPANLIAHTYEGEPLPREHGGPARLFVPHLYFWKSAKWLSGLEFLPRDTPGFWERYGYHIRGDPWKEERYS